jgi:hypothetical protein
MSAPRPPTAISSKKSSCSGSSGGPTSPLILKRAPIGWNQDDFDVLEKGILVGRIFFLDAVGPHGRPWMWASGDSAATIRRAAHGHEPTREAAMAAFAKSWRRG